MNPVSREAGEGITSAAESKRYGLETALKDMEGRGPRKVKFKENSGTVLSASPPRGKAAKINESPTYV